MDIRFTKMHGLGNDFMVINAIDHAIELTSRQITQLADRRFGIGFDQLLLLEPPEKEGVDVNYRIFNRDGSEVAQCGNGARCIAAYLYERGIIERSEIIAQTKEGLLRLQRLDDGMIRVNMGVPRFSPGEIPIIATCNDYSITVNDMRLDFTPVSLGNPHAVFMVENVENLPIDTLGPAIQGSGLFPEGVNVGFMQINDTTAIRLRVYERGAGETLACGSGACAAVAVGRVKKKLQENVDVTLNGGDLLVSWKGEGEPVFMTGPATFVYDGRVTL